VAGSGSTHRTHYSPYAGSVNAHGASALVALVLVAAPLTAIALAGTRPHTPVPVTAAMRRHYFELGRRECAQTIKQIEAQNSSGTLLGFAIAGPDGNGLQKEYRRALDAGCQAATG